MLKKLKIVLDVIAQVLAKIWIWLLVAVVVFAMVFNGIDIYTNESKREVDKVEYEEQDTLYFGIEKPDSLNPLSSRSEDVYYLDKLIYDFLFDYDEDLRVRPVLVKSYSVNTERGYIDCKLKNGIYFSNNASLTADDVVFTVNAIKSTKKGSPYYSIGKKISSCSKTGRLSFRINFYNSYNCSLDDLVFPVVPSGQYSSPSAFVTSKVHKPIGTGKYKFRSYNSNKYLKLVPNKKYRGTRAKNDVVFQILPERELAGSLMQIGEVTCMIDGSNNRKSEAMDRDFVIYDIPSNNVDFIVLNKNNPNLAKRKFRRAVNFAIDRQNILENAYMGDGILTDTIYYPNFLGVEDSLEHYKFNSAKVAEILSELGFSDSDGDGILDMQNGSKKKDLELDILVNLNNPMRTAAAKQIKLNLEQVGIKANLHKKKQKDYLRSIRKGNYDILVTGYRISQEYDLRSFFNGRSEWKYKDDKLYRLAAQLERLHRSSEYAEHYEKLKQAIIDDATYTVLCYRKESLIGVETFDAEGLPVFNNIYKNMETWSWKKRL